MEIDDLALQAYRLSRECHRRLPVIHRGDAIERDEIGGVKINFRYAVEFKVRRAVRRRPACAPVEADIKKDIEEAVDAETVTRVHDDAPGGSTCGAFTHAERPADAGEIHRKHLRVEGARGVAVA